MRAELSNEALPFLVLEGWKGKSSRYRRIKNGICQTLEIQFSKYGGSFAVNLRIVEPEPDFYTTKFDDLKVIRSQRVGTRMRRVKKKKNMDKWFKFMRGFIVYVPSYKFAAQSFLREYKYEAELIFSDMLESIKKGILCVHLE